jgi:hypothetical protein
VEAGKCSFQGARDLRIGQGFHPQALSSERPFFPKQAGIVSNNGTRRLLRDGYVRLKCTDSPMSKNGWVLEHRKVLYDKIGTGTHKCHWCRLHLEWKDICVDHLDEVRSNNNPNNLVPSCSKCNRYRNPKNIHLALRKANGREFTVGGKTMTLSEWAWRLGVSPSTITRRMKSGWSVDKALTSSCRNTGPKKTKYETIPVGFRYDLVL